MSMYLTIRMLYLKTTELRMQVELCLSIRTLIIAFLENVMEIHAIALIICLSILASLTTQLRKEVMQYTEQVSTIAAIVHTLVTSLLHGVALHQTLYQSTSSGLYFEPGLDSDPSQISSDPTRVCQCENGKINCSNTSWSETHYPGEEFSISAVDVGDTGWTSRWTSVCSVSASV